MATLPLACLQEIAEFKVLAAEDLKTKHACHKVREDTAQ
jgi:hypothetical protein